MSDILKRLQKVWWECQGQLLNALPWLWLNVSFQLHWQWCKKQQQWERKKKNVIGVFQDQEVCVTLHNTINSGANLIQWNGSIGYLSINDASQVPQESFHSFYHKKEHVENVWKTRIRYSTGGNATYTPGQPNISRPVPASRQSRNSVCTAHWWDVARIQTSMK